MSVIGRVFHTSTAFRQTEASRFVQFPREGSQRQLAELESAWSAGRPAYERELELEGKEMIQAKKVGG